MPVFADLGDLTVEDFSFVRAVVSGMEPAKAWLRYYGRLFNQVDVPHGHTLNAMAKQLQERIFTESLASADEQIRSMGAALKEVTEVVVDTSASTAAIHRDYNEWLATLESPDDWGETELLEMYQDHVQNHKGGTPLPSPASPDQASQVASKSADISAKVKALNYLQTALASRPSPDQDTTIWLHSSVTTGLAIQGVHTLGDLVRFIQNHGRHWARHVPKLGPGRAAVLLAWLDDHGESLGPVKRSGPLWLPKKTLQSQLEPLVRRSAPSLVADPATGILAPSPASSSGSSIAPFEALSVPPNLNGSNGMYRASTPCHYGVNTDYDAVRVWLGTFLQAGKMRTFEAYRREIERFYLWCMLEARIPLSSVSLAHAMGFQAFLRSIPQRYIGTDRVPRGDPLWRPWRGQISPRSQAYTLGVVSQFYADAVRNAYVTGNPFASVRNPAFDDRVLDTSRSLSDQDIGWVRECVLNLQASTSEASRSGAFLRRTKLILQLALNTGMRLDEMANASLNDIRKAIVDGVEQPDEWLLEVVGKGKKKRYVPLSGAIMRLISEHHGDVMAELKKTDTSDTRLSMFNARPPLICALQAPVGHSSLLIDELAPMANDNLALGRVGLYKTLKTFFRSHAQQGLKSVKKELSAIDRIKRKSKHGIPVDQLQAIEAKEVKLKQELSTWSRRSLISTHWLRHTFAKALLAANPDDSGLKLTQQLLGHASINTTQIYLKQDESAKIKAVRRINPLGL